MVVDDRRMLKKISMFTIADVAEVMSPDMLDEEKCR